MKEFNEVISTLDKVIKQTDSGSFPSEAYQELIDIQKFMNIDNITNLQLRDIVEKLTGIENSLERYEVENRQSEMAVNMVLHKVDELKTKYNALYIQRRVPNNGYIDKLYREDFGSDIKTDFNFKQMTVALAESPVGSKLEKKAVLNFLMEGNMNYLNEYYDDEDDDYEDNDSDVEYFDKLDTNFERSKDEKVAEKNLNKLVNSVKKASTGAKGMSDKQLAKANRIRFVRSIMTAILFCIGLKISSSAIGKARTALLGLISVIILKNHSKSEINRLIVILEDRIQTLENKIEMTEDEDKRKEYKLLRHEMSKQLRSARNKSAMGQKAKNAISRGDVNDYGDSYGF